MLISVSYVSAQWNAQVSNSTNPLSAVDFYNANNGWVGGFELIYTNDGGNNWLSPVFPVPLLFYMNANQTRDIKAFNSLKMIGVGQNNIDNASIIYSTFDGGVNWDTIVGRNGYGHNSIDFSTSQKGYVCGYYGQFFETLDGGINWSQVSLIPNTDWFKINFQNQDTAIVVGYNYSMKTLNGGATWIPTPNNLVLYDVMALSNNTCIAVGDDSNNDYSLFKSYDYGVNWIKITSIPFDETYIKRIWAFSEDSILLPSKGIMNSYRDGFWHSYPSTQLINTSNEFEDIDFINDTVGYAVGNNGQIYKTGNAFGDEAPYSFFTPDTLVVCQDDSIFFNNISETGLSYQWFQNGNLKSNNYNTFITFNNPGIDTISLVVDNGLYKDTSFVTINVLSKPIVNSFLLSANDSICSRSSSNIYLLNSQVGVTYQAYKDSLPFGTPSNGTGNNLSFNSGSLDSSAHFMFVGSDTNQCGDVHDTSYISIYVYPNLDPNTPLVVSDSTPCINQATTISFPNSDPGIEYNLYYKYDHVAWTQGPDKKQGNGGTLVFNLGTFASAFYQFVVINSHGCTDTLYQTLHTIVDSAIADFEITPNRMVGDTLFTTNNSVGGTYNWDFGFNTSPSQSTGINPFTVADSSYMSNPVQLAVTAPYGCVDTLVKLINIFDSVPSSSGSYCYMDTLPFHYQNLDYSSQTWEYGSRVIMDQETDTRGNTYISGYFLNSSSYQYPCYFITKIDQSGHVIWDKYENRSKYYNIPLIHPNDFQGSATTSITADCKGNVYFAGLSFSSAIVLPDTVINFDLMFGVNSPDKRAYVIKCDSVGNFLWGIFSDDLNINNGFGISDVLYVDDEHIYFYTKQNATFKFSNGNNYCTDVIQFNSKGEFIKRGGRLYNMDAGDWSMNTHGPIPGGGFILMGPKLSKLSNKDILLSGNFREHLSVIDVNNNTINLNSLPPVISTSGTTYNHFVAIMDKDSMEYKDAFVTHGISNLREHYLMVRPKVETDQNDNIYLAVNYRSHPNVDMPEVDGKKIILRGNIEFSGHHYNTSFLAKYDLAGNLQWHNKLTSSEITDIEVADSSVYLLGNFTDVIGASSQNGEITGVKSSGKEMFISSHSFNGDIEWINVIANNKNSFTHAMDITPCGDIYFSGKAEGNIHFNGDSTVADRSLFVGKMSLNNSCSSNSCQQFFGGSSCMADSIFCINDIIEIQWCSYGDNGLFDISYSLDSGTTYTGITQGYPSINSSFIWSPSPSLFTNQWVMITIVNPNDSTMTDSYWVFLDGCGVGFEELQNNIDLVVYPNPTNSTLNFELQSSKKISKLNLEIYDINGRKIISKALLKNHLTLDVSGLNKGVYFYRIIGDNDTLSGKVIVN